MRLAAAACALWAVAANSHAATVAVGIEGDAAVTRAAGGGTDDALTFFEGLQALAYGDWVATLGTLEDSSGLQRLFENESFLRTLIAYERAFVLNGAMDNPDSSSNRGELMQNELAALVADPCVWEILNRVQAAAPSVEWDGDIPSPSVAVGEVCTSLPTRAGESSARIDISTLEELSEKRERRLHKAAEDAKRYARKSHLPHFPPKRSREWVGERRGKLEGVLRTAEILGRVKRFREWGEDLYSDLATVLGTDDEADLEPNSDDDTYIDRAPVTNAYGDDASNDVLSASLPAERLQPYERLLDPVLANGTIGIRRVSISPRVYVVPNFATEEEMDELIRIAEAWQGRDKHDSTGRSFEMPIARYDVAHRVSMRMRALVGLGNDMGSTLRTRRYGPGDSHPEHVDWFEIENAHGKKSNLIATAMLNMRTTAVGGATEFIDAKPAPVDVRPVRGELVLWWSCNSTGAEDKYSMHRGNEVLAGEKYTVTQFFYQPLSMCSSGDNLWGNVQ